MIVLTAFAIGLVSASLRSTICHALTGGLIVATFALATIAAAGNVSWFALALAVLAYNAGIATHFLGVLVVVPRPHAK